MPYLSYFFQRYTNAKEQEQKRQQHEEEMRSRERAKAAPTLRGDFRLPFDDFNDFSIEDECTMAVSLVDLRMGKLSYALRSKPEWWKKFKNLEIRGKWEKEALEHDIHGGRLTKAEVKYALDELQGYEKMRDDATGIQQSCYQGIYEADGLVSEALRKRLISAVKVLEDVPDHKKDWHPRSNNQVLDLVHPSLYCIVYNRTLAFPANSDPANRTSADLKKLQHPIAAAAAKTGPEPAYENWSYSKKFCWIPTDFDIPTGGTPAKALSYINNIEPDLTELYSVVEGVVGRFSLLWDRVLTDLHPGNGGLKYRIHGGYEWNADNAGSEPEWQDDDEDAYDAAYKEWENKRVLEMPTVPDEGYTEDISQRKVQYTIQGKKVQVIVKLANIILTPESPSYPGGSWHVEGMANERIVASGIYYYDSENITESQLAFRMAVTFRTSRATGKRSSSESQSNQVVGAVKTIPKRCIAFPNIYQHQVSPFALVDPTKPGHRKIMALFLVDPEHRIPSTSDIPPQQEHWAQAAMATSEASSAFHLLPAEIRQMVAGSTEGFMSEAEAKDYRVKLMDERTAFVGVQDEKWFCTTFNFCEH
ncbi:hypothetical protein M407DRAFT_28093 [Tulasnella calospora MUT 4182]|uniref:Uncharacterized protein n=1 Tax=Tulasnella calospora MUT 4182 TaxID=1051891 RepID=A0A0C3QCP4_9AGAM|nr:hypothetical protein M407DRAFT_28093 [Tulasnella calospora MUT 4182]